MSLAHPAAVRLFRALNALPHLTEDERARISNAAETVHPATWADAKEIRLDTEFLRPLTLVQACHWAILPTADEIADGLERAAAMTAPQPTRLAPRPL